MDISSDIQLITISETAEGANHGIFSIEPLSPGYGTTIGNALRRIMLSSLTGAAITTVKIDEVNHEFTTIDGVKEDVVELILNLKGVRFKVMQDEPVTLTLSMTGPKEITAADFSKVANVEITNPDHHIATVDKKKQLIMEVVVEKGIGYLPTERRKDQKLPIGMIAIDSIFSPVTRVNFTTENTRVGQMTNYDKLILDIMTDGTIAPAEALRNSNQILIDHLQKIGSLIPEQAGVKPKAEKKSRKKTS